jgi:Fe-Mn family superoxide dismutase
MKNLKHTLILGLFILVPELLNLVQAQNGPFVLPKLPYAYNALEPVIDAQTMEIHYSRHHAAYVKNLNNAVIGSKYESFALEDLMLKAGDCGNAIRNNAGGVFNHSLYWDILSLNSPFDPQSEIGKSVIQTFGSLDSLKTLLTKAGATRFGSGWAWLYLTPDKKLAVCSSPNQDNPIMNISPERGIPVLGIDVWEHAYYLKYQNKRGDYLAAILGAINWGAVNQKYMDALNSKLLEKINADLK